MCHPICPDASLRLGDNGSYATFDAFMDYARQLDPIFLILHQFNEFAPPDEGFDANTDDDIEPADLWGNDLGIVKHRSTFIGGESLLRAKPVRRSENR